MMLARIPSVTYPHSKVLRCVKYKSRNLDLRRIAVFSISRADDERANVAIRVEPTVGVDCKRRTCL